VKRIGIDVGSTTVKVVALDEDGATLYTAYDRHLSRARDKTLAMLGDARGLVGSDGETVFASVTGSAGMGVSRTCSLPFVQEVIATRLAVDKLIPDADTVVELGGEDAKILFLTGGVEQRMNGSCAGGTGAFIDQMATLLDASVSELDELSLKATTTYRIASRCGVFAKSDLQPLLNQGARKEDVARSIHQAVVDQTISGLAQGRAIAGKVVFLGGPLAFQRGLRDRFAQTLSLDDRHAVFPDNGQYYPAIGAALFADQSEPIAFGELVSRLRDARESRSLDDRLPPLFDSREDYESFRERHARADAPRRDLAGYIGDAYLGIDAGSTTTKLVLIAPDGGVLYDFYSSNAGSPVETVRGQLERIYAIGGVGLKIRGSASTGYGEDLIKAAFSLDAGLVETVAHARAARRFCPDVDYIIDIGGQDIKCFTIRGGAVDGVTLNEACSSGCGSFLETFAKAMGMDCADFARLGLFAEHPVDLGSRCTVFMNSSVKQAQKDGASIEDISAGLSISVVKNALFKVIRANDPDELGLHIVAQGGTFLNDAVLRAFESTLGREVTRPALAGLMGAYGAALAAMDLELDRSAMIGETGLASFKHTVKTSRCGLCGNNCALTISTFQGGRRYIAGNGCERPVTGGERNTLPNLMRWKYETLRAMSGAASSAKGRIGIPMGLNMFENLPFWTAFFGTLGYGVAISDPSSRALYRRGQHTIPSDTVCYPAKLMHGHIESLLEKHAGEPLAAIFYPCMPYNFDEGCGDNHYNCPVVAYYPELLKANIPSLADGARGNGFPPFLTPYLNPDNERAFTSRARRFFGHALNADRAAVTRAARAAYASYRAWKNAVLAEGRKAIAFARETGRKMIVLAGRPYHVDPEIHHGVDSLLCALGLVVLTEDAILDAPARQNVKVLNQWTYQSRLYNAAARVAEEPDMELVQLVSFGCGIDAITTDETRAMMERKGRLYTQIKIDEITNLGAVKIRLRSLLAAMEERMRKAAPQDRMEVSHAG
jgi:predicted CoA-substrate-specific enzyme activase